MKLPEILERMESIPAEPIVEPYHMIWYELNSIWPLRRWLDPEDVVNVSGFTQKILESDGTFAYYIAIFLHGEFIAMCRSKNLPLMRVFWVSEEKYNRAHEYFNYFIDLRVPVRIIDTSEDY